MSNTSFNQSLKLGYCKQKKNKQIGHKSIDNYKTEIKRELLQEPLLIDEK